MIDKNKIIDNFELVVMTARATSAGLIYLSVDKAEEIAKLLKEQEAREPHYTTLRYLVDGTVITIRHPECPKCIENGLTLWDAEIEKGQAYCKRCGQAVKWEVEKQ